MITGGGDFDYINGGMGSDTMTGGAGRDYFTFGAREDGTDLITDFTPGEDVLRFSHAFLGALPQPAGPIAPDQISYDAAVGPEAQFVLRYDSNTDRTGVFWDSDGDAEGGLSITLVELQGNLTLTASDLVIF